MVDLWFRPQTEEEGGADGRKGMLSYLLADLHVVLTTAQLQIHNIVPAGVHG